MTAAHARLVVVDRSPLRPPLLWRDSRSGQWHLVGPYLLNRAPLPLLVVPADFTFDLASVPRAFRWLIGVEELSIVAPMVHDCLYRAGGVAQLLNGERLTYSRHDVDALFRDLMDIEGVPRWRRDLAYTAVRKFAAGAWRTPAPVAPLLDLPAPCSPLPAPEAR